MQVTVKLFATFRAGRFLSSTDHYPSGTTVKDVIRALQIPESEIGIIMMNNKHAEPLDQLFEGDHLSLFPLLGGG
jgi:molybdopterin converting factor small subunit